MHSSLGGIVPGLELDFYTAPTHAPKSIEGSYDGVVTAAAVVEELEEKLGGWNGVSCPYGYCVSRQSGIDIARGLEAIE